MLPLFIKTKIKIDDGPAANEAIIINNRNKLSKIDNANNKT